MSSVVEVNHVSDIESQAHGTEVAFQSAARIKDAVDIPGAKSIDGAEKGAGSCGSGIKTEIDPPALDREERADRPVSGGNGGTKQSVHNAKVGARNSNVTHNRSEVFGIDAVKVVRRFRFQSQISVCVEAQACPDSGHVGLILMEAEVVGKNANVNMIGTFLCGCGWDQAPREQ